MGRYFIVTGYELPQRIRDGWIETIVEDMREDGIANIPIDDKDGRIAPKSMEEYLYARAEEAVTRSCVEWEVRVCP